MSLFSFSISGLLARHRMDIFHLSKVSGLTVEKLWSWQSSKSNSITPQELVRLARAFNPKGKDFVETHAALLHANLKDLCTGPGANLIFLERIPYPNWVITTSLGRFYVTPRVKGDLEVVLNQICRNRKVRGMVHSIAKYCKNQTSNKEN